MNVFLAIVTVAAAIMMATTVLDAMARPGQWRIVALFSILTLMLAALASSAGLTSAYAPGVSCCYPIS